MHLLHFKFLLHSNLDIPLESWHLEESYEVRGTRKDMTSWILIPLTVDL